MLGYISSHPRPASVRGQAWDSRLGGLPSYFADPEERPCCRRCGSALFLVLQLYSPTDLERTLHVYGCNSSCCNRASRLAGDARGAWVVRRSQGGPASTAAAEPEAAAGLPTMSASSGAWGDAGDWDDSGHAGADAWAAAGSGLASVAAPLSKAATSHATASALVADAGGYATTSAVVVDSGGAASLRPPPASPLDALRFPAFDIITCEDVRDGDEPADCSDLGADHSDDEDEEDLCGGGSGDAATAHARALYAAYQRSEGDGGDAAGESRGEADGNNDSDASGDPQSPSARSGGGGFAGRSAGGNGGGAGGGGACSDRGGAELYEKVPERVRYALRFQSRLAQLPSQVVRYAYDGEPMWPCPPRPLFADAPQRRQAARAWQRPARVHSDGSARGDTGGSGDELVPPCGGCGSRRVFELQLMPHALSVLRVDELTVEAILGTQPLTHSSAMERGATRDADEAAASAVPASGMAPSVDALQRAKLPLDLTAGGMDWATVLIFVCPLACAESREEVAVVVE